MTEIKIHGILAKDFGGTFLMKLENTKDVFDAIDANRSGFKKRIFELESSGFHYQIIVDRDLDITAKEMLLQKAPKTIELVPVLRGDGAAAAWALVSFVVSTALQIALAPDPPEPPEISQTVSALEKSFTFSSSLNRAAQGTPVPVGYGQLIIGSEVIQTTIKSYPQSQRSYDAFRRNPFNAKGNPTQANTQLDKK